MSEISYPFLDVEGESAREVANHDWSATSLGAIDSWPPVLKTTIATMLRSAFPKALVWGPELVTFHNDAFRTILGNKLPAIGRPFNEIWAEAWESIDSIAQDALAGKATFIEDFPLAINRNGASEMAYFTFCYSPVVNSEGKIVGFMDTVVETTQSVQARERAELLNAELAHRIKNILALVSSIASQTMRSSAHLEDAERSLNRRLRALTSVQDVLRTRHKIEADLHGLVAAALDPHALQGDRVKVEGPSSFLPEDKALALSLALNELVTNAIKYGALSNDSGTVSISWNGDQQTGLHLVWREQGGPTVSAPEKTGFGSRLIQRHVASVFGGTAKMTFDREGLTYEIKPDAIS